MFRHGKRHRRFLKIIKKRTDVKKTDVKIRNAVSIKWKKYLFSKGNYLIKKSKWRAIRRMRLKYLPADKDVKGSVF